MEIKIFLYIIIILSATFHEYGHAFVANFLGDDTAKREGRLTLNPLKHIDPLGTVIIPLVLLLTSGVFIGWAKPVPYNPYNLKDKKYGSLKVGLAGPGANFIIAILLGLIMRFYPSGLFVNPLFPQFLGLIVYINIFLGLFNLLPIAPFDGSKIFADLFPKQANIILSSGFAGLFLALMVGFFVIPPIARILFLLIVGEGPNF
ncbi:MAG: site-2 protease family protein [Patescibacteria group bacterium]